MRYTEDSILIEYKIDIGTMMRNENPVLSKGTDTNTGHHASQHLQELIKGKDNVSKQSLELCNISAEYIEAITKAQGALLNYYTRLAMTQLNLLDYLTGAGFTKWDAQELFKKMTISTVQFWMNVCTLPWKLALGNVLCVKPLQPFRFSLQHGR
jgi:hypothetical protein